MMAGRHGDAGGRLREDDKQVPSLHVLPLNFMLLSYAKESNGRLLCVMTQEMLVYTLCPT